MCANTRTEQLGVMGLGGVLWIIYVVEVLAQMCANSHTEQLGVMGLGGVFWII